jgi:hypothetical protein
MKVFGEKAIFAALTGTPPHLVPEVLTHACARWSCVV